ncbi:unnamed protein product, partial [Prorocentrum cordatum]
MPASEIRAFSKCFTRSLSSRLPPSSSLLSFALHVRGDEQETDGGELHEHALHATQPVVRVARDDAVERVVIIGAVVDEVLPPPGGRIQPALQSLSRPHCCHGRSFAGAMSAILRRRYTSNSAGSTGSSAS